MKEIKIGETFILNNKVYKCEKENSDTTYNVCYGCAFDNETFNCITKTLYPCGNHNRKDEQGVRYVEVELNSNDIEPFDSTKEYNIGDKFIFNDSIIQVCSYKEYRNVSKGVCNDCVFNINNGNCLRKIPNCFSSTRKDKTSIIYLKEDFCKLKGITNDKTNNMEKTQTNKSDALKDIIEKESYRTADNKCHFCGNYIHNNNKLNVPKGYKAIAINDDGTIQLEPIHKEKSWEEFGKVTGYYIANESDIESYTYNSVKANRNVYPTKELAEAALALCQLLQWKNKINYGWTPNWEDNEDTKFAIFNKLNAITIQNVDIYNKILCFETKEIAEQFLKDHKSLIETAKPLL